MFPGTPHRTVCANVNHIDTVKKKIEGGGGLMQIIFIKNVMQCRDKFGAIMKGYDNGNE